MKWKRIDQVYPWWQIRKSEVYKTDTCCYSCCFGLSRSCWWSTPWTCKCWLVWWHNSFFGYDSEGEGKREVYVVVSKPSRSTPAPTPSTSKGFKTPTGPFKLGLRCTSNSASKRNRFKGLKMPDGRCINIKDASLSNIGEAGSWLEICRRGKY